MSNRTIAGLSTFVNRVAMAANVLGTIVVLVLVLVVNFDVVARGVFSAPFRGATEVVQFSIVLIVFLQLPDVVRVDRLTRSDGFLILIGDSFPRLTAFLKRVIYTMGAVFMGLIAWIMFPEVAETWHTNEYFGVPGVFTAPWWPIKLTITFSALLCTIIFIFKILAPATPPELIRAPEHKDDAR